MAGRLLAISDLHIGHQENRAYADALSPRDPADWLIVAGDVGEVFADIGFVLASLANRFARVIWTPGNHELWTLPSDPVPLRGVARYQALVTVCRRFGVLTPEDEFAVWDGPGGPVTVAPLFTLYDYSFTANGSGGGRRTGSTGKEDSADSAAPGRAAAAAVAAARSAAAARASRSRTCCSPPSRAARRCCSPTAARRPPSCCAASPPTSPRPPTVPIRSHS
jgi:3',5'-cyclic AMP phosphodiesterase CpdA